MSQVKICSKCNIEKDLELFSRSSKNKTDGRRASCKECEKIAEKNRNIKLINDVKTVPEGNTKAVKTCRKCGLEAITQDDLKMFKSRPTRVYGRDSICKECNKIHSRYGNLSEQSLNTRKRNSLKNRLKNKYNMTFDEYDKMLENHPCCEICNSEFDESLRPCVDHCHETGKVRGLLCDGCNTSIGRLGDNADALKRAYEYLLKAEQ